MSIDKSNSGTHLNPEETVLAQYAVPRRLERSDAPPVTIRGRSSAGPSLDDAPVTRLPTSSRKDGGKGNVRTESLEIPLGDTPLKVPVNGEREDTNPLPTEALKFGESLRNAGIDGSDSHVPGDHLDQMEEVSRKNTTTTTPAQPKQPELRGK